MNGEGSYEEDRDSLGRDEQSHLDSDDAKAMANIEAEEIEPKPDDASRVWNEEGTSGVATGANIPVEQTISNPDTDSPKPDGGLYVRDGDTLVISTDYYSISREENSRLLTPTQIGDALDLEKEKKYPCSDGSITYTVNVDELLKAQRGLTASIKNTEIQELKAINEKHLQLNGELRVESADKDAEFQTRVDRIFKKIKKYRRDEGGIELHSNWNGILIPEPDWLEIETQRGLVEGDESIKNTAKYYLAKVRGMIEGAGLTDEDIKSTEDIFIEDAKAKDRELSKLFIDGDITYSEYEKKSQLYWTGCYRRIAQSQLQKVKDAIDKD